MVISGHWTKVLGTGEDQHWGKSVNLVKKKKKISWSSEEILKNVHNFIVNNQITYCPISVVILPSADVIKIFFKV